MLLSDFTTCYHRLIYYGRSNGDLGVDSFIPCGGAVSAATSYLIIILIYVYCSVSDHGGKYQRPSHPPMQFANMLPDSLYGLLYAAILPCLATRKSLKNLVFIQILSTARYGCRGTTLRCIFVRKFNNRLLFSTFICPGYEITNIISIMRRQAPENDVKKITVARGDKREETFGKLHNQLINNNI